MNNTTKKLGNVKLYLEAGVVTYFNPAMILLNNREKPCYNIKKATCANTLPGHCLTVAPVV